MENTSIAYLWVENYQNVLVNIGFNFGCESKFNIVLNRKTIQLEVNQDDLFVTNFFKLDDIENGIENITAIIGKNGTGKSLLCKLVREIMSGGYPSTDYLIVFRTNSKKLNILFKINLVI